MTTARLMTTPQDHRALGLAPGRVENWEDGYRQRPGDGRAEVWHFDGRLSDGTTVALAFCLVGVDPADSTVLITVVNAMITTADGRQSVHAVPGTVRESDLGATHCSLPFGVNHARGDLSRYDLHIEAEDGALVIDLTYEALTEAYRPGGTGHVALGDDEQTRFADLMVPRCSITGWLQLDGDRRQAGGKELPLRSTYVVESGGRTCTVTFAWEEVLSAHDLYAGAGTSELGAAPKEQFDEQGIRPSYARFAGTGTLEISDADGVRSESGEVVYEFNYPGIPDPRAAV